MYLALLGIQVPFSISTGAGEKYGNLTVCILEEAENIMEKMASF